MGGAYRGAGPRRQGSRQVRRGCGPQRLLSSPCCEHRGHVPRGTLPGRTRPARGAQGARRRGRSRPGATPALGTTWILSRRASCTRPAGPGPGPPLGDRGGLTSQVAHQATGKEGHLVTDPSAPWLERGPWVTKSGHFPPSGCESEGLSSTEVVNQRSPEGAQAWHHRRLHGHWGLA